MLENQHHGNYVSRMRCSPMRVLPYNKGPAAVVVGSGQYIHGIRSGARFALIGQLQLWLPRRVDMQGWKRGKMWSRENSACDAFRFTGVFKSVRVGHCEIEKSVCTIVLLLPYYESINATTKSSSSHVEATSFYEKYSLILIVPLLNNFLLSSRPCRLLAANMSLRTVTISSRTSSTQATSVL